MIYNGSSNAETGDTTQYSTSSFNSNRNDNAYVGYMYGFTNESGAEAYINTHKNINSSTIKEEIESWYQNRIEKNTNYTKYIEINVGFCGDRNVDKTADSKYQGDGYGNTQTGYAPWGRLHTNGNWKIPQKPSLKCTIESNDLYTVTTSARGNKALEYPVGLITSDEVVFAGGMRGYENTEYWLNTEQFYWTMSPHSHYIGAGKYYANVFIVSQSGLLSSQFVNYQYGIRPVINLKANTTLTGSGTSSDPFVVS